MKDKVLKLAQEIQNGETMRAAMDNPGMKLFMAHADSELQKLYTDLNKINYNNPGFDPDKDMKIKNLIAQTITGANRIRTIPETIISRGLRAQHKINLLKEKEG